MAKITAGVTTSHVPAIAATIDLKKQALPYWAPMTATTSLRLPFILNSQMGGWVGRGESAYDSRTLRLIVCSVSDLSHNPEARSCQSSRLME